MNTFEFAKSEIKEILGVLPSLREKGKVAAYKTLLSTFERFVSSIKYTKLNESDTTYFKGILYDIENELSLLSKALKEERVSGNYKNHHDYTVAYEKLLRTSRDLKYSTDIKKQLL